ncbi:MAG TPA: phosphatidate cytidylyltransferase [Roseiflexaceae bacterium]|nr:phosphatidate cytidylyltransferase [Roseiflexaceae bacterium]
MKANSLAQRIGSALVLLPAVIIAVWWSHWAVIAALVALLVIGLLELYGALQHGGYIVDRNVGIVLALALAAALIADRMLHISVTPAVVTAAVMISLAAVLPAHDRKGILADWGLTLAGALYLALLSGHVALVRLIDTPLSPAPLSNLGISPGAAWLYLLCAVTWLQDTLAYFVGKSWGRTKMAPTLSPKKTWEGAAGGMAGAILGGMIVAWLCGLPGGVALGALLGVIGGVTGPLGDLAESMIKRQAGLKDVGSLIPGHGGMLDRVDSFVFNAPVLYYLILLLVPLFS